MFWWYQAGVDYYWDKRAITDQTQISKLFLRSLFAGLLWFNVKFYLFMFDLVVL